VPWQARSLSVVVVGVQKLFTRVVVDAVVGGIERAPMA